MRGEEKTIHKGFATVWSEAEPVDVLKTHLKTHFYSQAFNCVKLDYIFLRFIGFYITVSLFC